MRHAQRVKAAVLASLATIAATAGVAEGIEAVTPPSESSQTSAPATAAGSPRESNVRLIVIRQRAQLSAPRTIYVNAPTTTVQAPAPAPVTTTS